MAKTHIATQKLVEVNWNSNQHSLQEVGRVHGERGEERIRSRHHHQQNSKWSDCKMMNFKLLFFKWQFTILFLLEWISWFSIKCIRERNSQFKSNEVSERMLFRSLTNHISFCNCNVNSSLPMYWRWCSMEMVFYLMLLSIVLKYIM